MPARPQAWRGEHVAETDVDLRPHVVAGDVDVPVESRTGARRTRAHVDDADGGVEPGGSGERHGGAEELVHEAARRQPLRGDAQHGPDVHLVELREARRDGARQRRDVSGDDVRRDVGDHPRHEAVARQAALGVVRAVAAARSTVAFNPLHQTHVDVRRRVAVSLQEPRHQRLQSRRVLSERLLRVRQSDRQAAPLSLSVAAGGGAGRERPYERPLDGEHVGETGRPARLVHRGHGHLGRHLLDVDEREAAAEVGAHVSLVVVTIHHQVYGLERRTADVRITRHQRRVHKRRLAVQAENHDDRLVSYDVTAVVVERQQRLLAAADVGGVAELHVRVAAARQVSRHVFRLRQTGGDQKNARHAADENEDVV